MAQLTNHQLKVQRVIDNATSTCIAYAANEVPSMGNLTPEGLVEELGNLNAARKVLEKTEKIIKERLKSTQDPTAFELKSDNFVAKLEQREATRLDQAKAKKTLDAQGVLQDHMTTSQTGFLTVKER